MFSCKGSNYFCFIKGFHFVFSENLNKHTCVGYCNLNVTGRVNFTRTA